MTRAEFNELGISESQYEEYFGEKVTFDDPEPTEALSVESEVEVEAPIEETHEAITDVAADTGITFTSIKAAAEFLAGELNLKVTNTLDCLYKCLKSNHKTHHYAVERRNDKSVVLTPIA